MLLTTWQLLLLSLQTYASLNKRTVTANSKRAERPFLFDLNTHVKVESENDFQELRKHIGIWKKRFPMFVHDVRRIEQIVEHHIKNHSIALVNYRQTHGKNHLAQAQTELDEINRVVATVEKIELMAMLSRG